MGNLCSGYNIKERLLLFNYEEMRGLIRIIVTIQPYKLWLVITKVYFIAFYETFIANVLRYRFHECQDIIEVKSNY